jgi:ankyrin repeat protein
MRRIASVSPDVNCESLSGETAVHLAAVKGHVHVLDILADQDAVLDLRSKIGQTPRQMAAVRRNLGEAACADSVKFLDEALSGLTAPSTDSNLRESDANDDEDDGPGVPRSTAEDAGSDVSVKHQSLWDSCVANQPRPLSVLISDEERRQLLGDDGAEPLDLEFVFPGTGGQRAIHAAVDFGNTACVRLLLQAGADPDAQTSAGLTAAFVAAARGYADILRVLASFGADLDLGPAHRTPAEAARRRGGSIIGTVEQLRKMSSDGVDDLVNEFFLT